MLTQIALGIALVGVTAFVQALVMLSGFRALEALRVRERDFSTHHATFIIILFVLFIFLAMFVETMIWAWAFLHVEAVSNFETALFVSIGSFTTIGYHDGQVVADWRLLVVFEGMCGMLIFGWATALVIAAIQHFDVWPAPREPSD